MNLNSMSAKVRIGLVQFWYSPLLPMQYMYMYSELIVLKKGRRFLDWIAIMIF